MKHCPDLTRREFLIGSVAGCCAAGLRAQPSDDNAKLEPIIDIHQHSNYSGRTNKQLLAHQRAMGVTQTVLLPAGRFYGLDADCGGNGTVVEFVGDHPGEFVFFANEVSDLPEAPEEIRTYLKRGALGVGEQKFRVACDSPEFHRIAEVAQEFEGPLVGAGLREADVDHRPQRRLDAPASLEPGLEFSTQLRLAGLSD